jgi:hypothetical protein
MAAELPTSLAPNRNPFRRSQAEPGLTYAIDGRKVHISPPQYRDYQRLFTKHTKDREFIQGNTTTVIFHEWKD